MEYNEGDLVLGKVQEVSNSITTVELPDGSKGTIISSEIASGRIKFMRNYVVPNKTIVCKILEASNGRIALSLRRVNVKEKKAVLQEHKQKIALKVALKQILKEDYEKVTSKILKDYKEIIEFIEAAKEDHLLVEKYFSKDSKEKILVILNKKKKQSELRYELEIKCMESDGLTTIKKILDVENKSLKINYISAGKFSMKYSCDDFKKGKQELKEVLDKIESDAKDKGCEFNLKEIR
jgi:translation initiation factor 2 alpha subunit (eIF-2alpha)